MANEKRLIDANALSGIFAFLRKMWSGTEIMAVIDEAPTIDAYTEKQLAHILNSLDKLEAENKELRTENVWLKSCLNCKIRKECPKHCGKVVHNCDHWEYGDSTIDAVEVVHGRWIAVPSSDMMTGKAYKCSECNKMRYGSFMPNYCQNCGAKMDGGNEDG